MSGCIESARSSSKKKRTRFKPTYRFAHQFYSQKKCLSSFFAVLRIPCRVERYSASTVLARHRHQKVRTPYSRKVGRALVEHSRSTLERRRPRLNGDTRDDKFYRARQSWPRNRSSNIGSRIARSGREIGSGFPPRRE